MNRLTHGGYFCDIVMCRKMLDGSPCDEDGYCLQHKVWERLKAYEDTGLDPEEIKEILDAINGGLSARDGILCPECGDALVIDVVDGVFSIGCFGCEDYTPISKLMKLHNELRLHEPTQAKKGGRGYRMRLIDADLAPIYLNGAACEQIKSMPTIDAVPVVRCGECRYWDEDGRCEPLKNGLIREYTEPNDFCSYGERRNEEI